MKEMMTPSRRWKGHQRGDSLKVVKIKRHFKASLISRKEVANSKYAT